MATATVSEREITPARPAVVEKTITLTLTENEAAGLAAITGRLQSQEYHPNSLYKVYRAVNGVVSYSKRPQVSVDKHYGTVKFAED